MRTFVFALGSCGARVVSSYAMLMAAGCKGASTDNEIIPLLIDLNEGNENVKYAADLLECYHAVNRQVTTQLDRDEKMTDTFFSTRIVRPYALPKRDGYISTGFSTEPDRTFVCAPDRKELDMAFADFIGLDYMNDDNGLTPTRHLLESLYDEAGELRCNIGWGDRGRLNIGCVMSQTITTLSMVHDMIRTLGPGDRLMIIGDILGPLGATAISRLISLVCGGRKPREVTIGVLLVMPHYKSPSAADGDEDLNVCARNVLKLLRHDANVMRNADTLYVIGDKCTKYDHSPVDDGSKPKSGATMLDLMAASAIMHFVGEPSHMLKSGSGARIVRTSLNDVYPDRNIRSFDDTQRRDFVYPLCRLAIFSVFFENYILKDKCAARENAVTQLFGTYPSPGLARLINNLRGGFFKPLGTFFRYFRAWVADIQDVRQRSPLCLFGNLRGYESVFSNLSVKEKGMLFENSVLSKKSIIGGLNQMMHDKYPDSYRSDSNVTQKARTFLECMEEVTEVLFDQILKINKI